MRPVEEGYDEIYFARRATWRRRVVGWLNREEESSANPFLEANSETVRAALEDPEAGVRMVVNMPADALLGFVRDNKYLNAYDRPVVGNKSRGPSATRQKVDRLLGLGDDARDYYFGAVAVGGTGVRFYGEYCLVLRNEAVPPSTQVFDRNSYDLIRPPLVDVGDKNMLVRTLRGKWSRDLVDMLTLRVLPELRHAQRVVTVGVVSDAILHDESFAEVHRKGTFAPADIEEARVAPEDHVLAGHILDRYEMGILPSAEELLWSSRRALVDLELARSGLCARTVTQSGRGNRWR